MARVRWTAQALDDLEAVCDYIARDAPEYAQMFSDGAFENTDRLNDFPRMGRMIPEIGDEDMRELIYKNYRIMYVVSGEEVSVLTVYHSARQFGPSDLSGNGGK